MEWCNKIETGNSNRWESTLADRMDIMLDQQIKLMKRFILIWMFLPIFLLTIIPAGQTKASSATAMQLKKKLTLARYQKVKLGVKNETAAISWFTSDPTVATVTKHGIVRTKKPGKCKIVAKANGKQYVCRLTVKPLAMERESVLLVCGRQMALNLNSPNVAPVWSSSNKEIATVDQNGVVWGHNFGKCAITAVYKKEKLTCKVEVIGASPENLAASYTADKINFGKIVLAGSSSLDYWKTASQAFAPYPVINMAIGGTSVVQWLTWYQDMIVDYNPSAVVLYVGSNDLGNGSLITGEKNAVNTIRLLKRLKKRMWKTPIFYVGISPCWSRKGAWQDIAVSNRLVREFCAQYQNLYYIDIASACAMADGTPNKELFLSDQLHPNAAGYAVWKRVVARPVKKIVKKMAKTVAKK